MYYILLANVYDDDEGPVQAAFTADATAAAVSWNPNGRL